MFWFALTWLWSSRSSSCPDCCFQPPVCCTARPAAGPSTDACPSVYWTDLTPEARTKAKTFSNITSYRICSVPVIFISAKAWKYQFNFKIHWEFLELCWFLCTLWHKLHINAVIWLNSSLIHSKLVVKYQLSVWDPVEGISL